MTLPIQLVPVAPEGAAPGAPAALPTGAEAAAIATEFRSALSSALGARPRRARSDAEPAAARDTVPGPAAPGDARPRVATERRMVAPPADAVPGRADDTVPVVAAALAPVEGSPTPAPTAPASEFVETVLGATPDEGEVADERPRATVGWADARPAVDVVPVTAPTIPATTLATVAVVTSAPGDAASARGDATSPAPRAEAPAPRMSDLERRAAALLADPAATIRDRALLQPEFGHRLERVIERMESEFGYTVEVVETHRTQQRQDTLFAQGRTTPGPVVTWTRDSKHTEGAAADVTINGGWSDRAGFERLARVAKEEGLRTLWPRDPGHVELAAREGIAPGGARPRPAGVQPAEGRVTLPVVGEVRTMPVHHPEGPDRTARALPAPILPSPGAGLTPPRIEDVRGLVDAFLEAGPTPSEVNTPRWRTSNASWPVAEAGAPVRAVATGGVATVASVAAVATVATVAEVARVATVATPGRKPEAPLSGVREAEHGDAPRAMPADDLQAALSALVRGSDDRPQVSRGAPRPGPTAGGTERIVRTTEGGAAAALEREPAREDTASPLTTRDPGLDASITLGGGDAGLPTREDAGLPALERVARTDAAERIARALRLQDSQADLPVSSVTLRLDHPEGGEDRIRIDLRGASVGARLEIADPVAAEQVRLHTSELRQALESRGLDGEGIAVRTVLRGVEGTSTAAVAASGEREGLRAASAQGGQGSSSGASRDSRHQARGEEFTREHQQPSSRQPRDQRGQRR